MRATAITGIAGLVAVTAIGAYRLGEYQGEEAARAATPTSLDWLNVKEDWAIAPTPPGDTSRLAPEGAARPPASTAAHVAALAAETPADLLAVETEFAQAYATYALAARADRAAIEALLREAQSVSLSGDRINITNVFFSRYVEIDPMAAIAFLRTEGFEPMRSHMAHIFASWTFADVEAAIAAASGLANAAEKNAANEGILRMYSDQGAAKLAEIGARLRIGGQTAAMHPLAVVALAQTDPRTAIEQVAQLPTDLRGNVAMEIGRAWAAQDAEIAYRHAQSLPVDPLKQPLLSGIFYQWIATAPERVIELLDAGVSVDEQRAIVNYGVQRLARVRPQSTFELVRTMKNRSARDVVLRMTLQLWAQDDPPAAVAALDTLDPEASAQYAMIVAAQYARVAPENALEWATRRDDGYGQTWRSVMAEVARNDAQRGLDFASRAPAESRVEALTTVMFSIAQADPATAAQHWRQLPAEVRSNGTSIIALQWVQRDPAAAEAWVLALPRGTERDAGLSALLTNDGIDVRDAPRLVNAIETETERGAAASAVVRRALRTGSALDAELLLNQMDLSGESRASIRELIEGNRTGRPIN